MPAKCSPRIEVLRLTVVLLVFLHTSSACLDLNSQIPATCQVQTWCHYWNARGNSA